MRFKKGRVLKKKFTDFVERVEYKAVTDKTHESYWFNELRYIGDHYTWLHKWSGDTYKDTEFVIPLEFLA